ncbi:MAG: J domain-containing protein [Thermodesulfobacteriota bacterium]
MLDILGRLYRIARSKLPRSDSGFGKFVSGEDSDYGEDDRFSMGDENQDGFQAHSDARGDFRVPQQVRDDLAVFQLTPPSSFQEVRSARNREIKKYHSDKFINDPEKLKASKEIMQIYNAAYDRLKTYYDNRC